MKHKKLLIVSTLLILLGAGFFLYRTNQTSPTDAPRIHDHGPKHTDDENKANWTCPMHPQIKKDGPGKCPICGMDLVRADSAQTDQKMDHADNVDGHASFKLSPGRQQMIGVKFGALEKKLLFKSIEAAGRVAFDPELYTAQNEYIEAVRQLERVKDAPIADVRQSAQRMMESAKLRLKILGLSDSQISRLRSSKELTTGSNLLVPSPGESVWVYAEVFEMDLSSVEPGLEVKITGGSLGGRELQGKVASVDRVINSATRTAKVRILVPNAKAQLRPEAYVDVTILSPLGEQLVVPFDAVLDSGKEAWIFVAQEKDGQTEFEPRKVLIKHYAGDEIALFSGPETSIEAGEKIVTSANFLVDSESRLKGVLNSQFSTNEPNNFSKPPSCPDGQEWHEQMKHCMPKVGS